MGGKDMVKPKSVLNLDLNMNAKERRLKVKLQHLGIGTEIRNKKYYIDIERILANPKEVKKIKGRDAQYSLVIGLLRKYTQNTKLLKDVLTVATKMDAEFGILLGTLMKMSNNKFDGDWLILAREKNSCIINYVNKYWKYLTDNTTLKEMRQAEKDKKKGV